jgi:hypothetical protein
MNRHQPIRKPLFPQKNGNRIVIREGIANIKSIVSRLPPMRPSKPIKILIPNNPVLIRVHP